MLQVAAQTRAINEIEKVVIGRLLVEVLEGKVQQETMDAVRKLDLEHIDGPYRHMIYYTDTDDDGKRWATTLRDELRIACMELLDPNHLA